MIGNWMRASVQDPMFGINHANIASELTPSNWRRKAIVRNGLYIWVVRGWQSTGNGGKRPRYYVQIHCQQTTNSFRRGMRVDPSVARNTELFGLMKNYAKRDAALAYANQLGDTEGERPQERGTTTYITMSPGFGFGPITTELPTDKEGS